ncbi:MAG: hypothetical protein PUJ92_06115 [Bacilli bacterium]|nr:hypothetical protein [Bacilli bacterium]MDY5832045.1 hypothetical protein [Candidatus Onthovivens sp.]
MKEITKIMVNDFKIMKLGMDFMGYHVNRKQDLSYHHLIIPRRHCKEAGLGEGYLYWNGAILRQNTSHDYLHIIEKIDPDIFYELTSEMIDENIKGRLDIDNLKRIHDLLLYFEREHDHDTSKKGKLLIKREFVTGRVNL